MPSPSQDAFRLVLARPVLTPAGDHPSLVHLSWFESEQGLTDRLVQVYIDNTLYATLPPQPNHTWLHLDRTTPHAIELLAVEQEHAADDLSSSLNTWSPPYQFNTAVTFQRDPQAPLNATLTATDSHNQTLAADLIWPPDTPRAGFGAIFGLGPFGSDAAASPGLGLMPLGYGPLDADAPPLQLPLPQLPNGTHAIALTPSHQPDQSVSATLTLDRPLHPAV